MSSGNEYSIGAIIPICCAINGPKGCIDSQRDMPIRTTRHPTLTLLESDLALLFAIPFQEDLSRALGSHAGSLTPQCGQERADANTPLPHSQHLTCSIFRLNLWSGFWGQAHISIPPSKLAVRQGATCHVRARSGMARTCFLIRIFSRIPRSPISDSTPRKIDLRHHSIPG